MVDKRINFGQALKPFAGYELDYAVGTTYSLSLEALMFIPATLFFGEELNVDEPVLTSDMLEALTKVPEQVQLFCQRGKLQKPSFYHNILAFWENSVEQVHLDTYLRSFHPKIWIVRYTCIDKDGPVKYKFICSSRNLTLCRDWDMAVQLEGTVQKAKYAANRPLLEFMLMLNGLGKRKIKQDILQEIMHISFDLTGEQRSYAFHPIGFNNKSHPLLANGVFNNHLLIISPFLQKNTIQAHRSRSKTCHLFSNAYELDKIDSECLDKLDNVFMFHPSLDQTSLSEPDDMGDDIEADKNITGSVEPDEAYNPGMSLHAKLYITQNSKQANWFIGSANCSNPATARNIEFLTEISFNTGRATIEDVWTHLVTPAKGQGMFLEYTPSPDAETDEEKRVEAELRKLIYELAAAVIKGEAAKREDGRFDLTLGWEGQVSLRQDWRVFVVPLSGNHGLEQELKAQCSKQTFTFSDFEESNLSPYILCSISYGTGARKQLVLDCEIQFDDSRMRRIFTSIIHNKEKLFKYLSAILSKEEVLPLQPLKQKQEEKHSRSGQNLESLPLYEKLLLAASRDKKKIRLASKTLEYLKNEKDSDGNPIVEDAFVSFFEVFKPFADEV